MKGDPEVIELLNACLAHEFSAINQYFIHSRMCQDWGYQKLAKKKYDESIEEMRHADRVIQRILFLGGVPNMQKINPVRVGENVKEQHEVDLKLEMEALERLSKGIATCRDKLDEGTRQLLDGILHEEEEGIDWLEAHLELIEQVGIQNYLAQMIGDIED